MFRWLAVLAALGAMASSRAADNAKIAERYQQMLAQNPAEGIALDRLWQIAQESRTTGQLLEDYQAKSDTLPGALVYGHLLKKAGRAEDARAAYGRAARLDEKSALPHLALAQLHSENSAWREAADEWDRAVALLAKGDARLLETLLKAGNAWLGANDADKAAADFERALSLNPADLSLRQRLADAYEKNGLAEKAAEHLRYLADHGEPSARVPALQRLARLGEARGDFEGATGALDGALAMLAPGHWLRAELQGQLIKLHERYHRTAELEARWKTQAAQQPREAGAWLQLADFYARTFDAEQERAALEKLCALAPKNTDYKIRVARAAAQTGDWARAAAALDEALAAQPKNTDLIFERAQIELRQDAVSAARQRVDDLVQRASEDETIALRAIEWFSKNRMTEAAEAQLKRRAARDQNGALALANWYFTQNKTDEAKRALQQLVRPDQPPATQAEALGKIAESLREHDDLEGALAASDRAIALDSKSSARKLAHADLLLGARKWTDAQNAAAQAFALAETDEARLAADQKLLQIFQTPTTTPMPAPDLLSPRVWPMARTEPPSNAALEKFLAELGEKTKADRTAAGLLRLSRWQSWARKNSDALDSARAAIAIEPKRVAAYQLAADAAAADGKAALAIPLLRELAQIAPAEASACLTRIGKIELESGHVEEALKIFEELAAAHPGDLEMLSNLALAQQRAERWLDALETWQRAFRASPPLRKREFAQPLLQVFERLSLHQRAAELLLENVDAAADETARAALFEDLLGLCRRHDLSNWLLQQMEQRRRAHPDDHFAAVASARVLREMGRNREALAALADAIFTSRDEPSALAELVREAGENGDFDTAIRFQKHLVALAGTAADSAALQKLAGLQESNLDLAAATATWKKTAQFFPRDAAALNNAWPFYLRWNEPAAARETLEKLRTLDPANASALIQLARLSDDATALACHEQILRTTPMARENHPGTLARRPSVRGGGLQRTYFTALRARQGSADAVTFEAMQTFFSPEPGGRGTPEFRLLAIREISTILARSKNERALQEWLARAEKFESATEAVCAFFHAGARGPAVAKLRAMLQNAPDDLTTRQAFIWLALEMGDYVALRDWMLAPGRETVDRDLILVAIGQWLKEQPLDPNLPRTLFPPDLPNRALLWQAAVLFASENEYATAAELGQRVFDGESLGRASYGVELAHWYLYMGERGKALRVLQPCVDEPASAPGDATFAALREYALLLPNSERGAFREEFASKLPRDQEPLRSGLSALLLAGLQGDDAAAKRELDGLLAMRAISLRGADEHVESAVRYWEFVLGTGAQLLAWKLDRLAGDLLQKALADRAAILLQGDRALVLAHEAQLRLSANELMRASGAEAGALVEEVLREQPADFVQALASALENNGDAARAADLLHALWRREPQNVALLRALLNVARSGQDGALVKETLAEVGARLPRDLPGTSEARLELIDALVAAGEPGEARVQIETALRAAPNDPGPLGRLAQLEEQAGDQLAAEVIYRKLLVLDPANDAHRIHVANTLAHQGKPEAAIELLRAGKAAPPIDALLASLYFDAGKMDAARDQAQKLLREGNAAAIIAAANRFVKAGDAKEALRLLFAAEKKAGPANAAALQQFLQIAAAHAPELARARLTALKADAEENGGRANMIIEARAQLSAQAGLDPQKILEEDWRAGRGAVTAGQRLLAIYAKAGDGAPMEKVALALAARADAPDEMLKEVGSILANAKRSDLAVKVLGRLAARNRVNENAACDFIRALHAAGQAKEARAELEKLAGRVVMSADLAGKIAPLFALLGEHETAREMFQEALRIDPAARNAAVWFGYVDFLIERGEGSVAVTVLERLVKVSRDRAAREKAAALQLAILSGAKAP